MLGFFLRSGGRADPRIPVGGVLLKPASGIPAGWEAYTPQENRALIGADTISEPSADFRTTNGIQLTGKTTVGGAHNGTGAFNQDGTDAGPGSTTIYRFQNNNAHQHDLLISRSYSPASVNHPLMRKTGTPGQVPAGAGLFAPGVLPSAAVDEIATYIGKVLRHASTLATSAAVSALGVSAESTHLVPGHVHGTYYQGESDIDFSPPQYANLFKGQHAHPTTINVTAINLPVARVAHYQANAQTVCPVGTIIAFDGSEDDLLDGWRFCDGSNGSTDLRGRYLEFSTSGNAGVLAGDGTVVWTGTMEPGGAHDGHRGSQLGYGAGELTGHSDPEPDHTHSGWAEQSGEIRLSRHRIRFIQFLP